MDEPDKRRLLREMIYARRFEERCFQGYMERKIGGFLHLYVGQEACCIGVMAVARPGHDYVITGYRDHVHALAAGVDPNAVMAELYGRATGCSGGYGGSMHLFDTGKRFMGGYALVGGPFPLAAGIAKTIKLQGGDEIAICFLGDAANNQGTFHETMNMASLWKLPVLYVCENNLYGIGTALDRSTVVRDQYKRLASYDIPAASADGQDIDAVMAAARVAVDHVRTQRSPYFLELKTYRFRGHSMSDAGAYRSKDEVEEWKERDPIEVLLQRLIEAGVMTREDYEAMDEEVIEEIEAGPIAFSEASPEPPVSAVTQHVFADDDPYVTGGPR